MNIAILTTVINFELYEKTSKYFPEGIPRYVIDGRNGMHGIHSINFMMKKLQSEAIEWLIMCDEDVVWEDPTILSNIIDYMSKNQYIVSGVRDGGVITQRVYSPYVINTFFSVIHFSELQKIWKQQEITQHYYIAENEFDDNIDHLTGRYDRLSLFEPYYAFYFWLRRKQQKILFLDAAMTSFDEVTNSVSFNNKILLYHTWYARSYGSNPNQTRRINKVLEQVHSQPMQTELSSYIYFNDPLFKVMKQIRKQRDRILFKLNAFWGW